MVSEKSVSAQAPFGCNDATSTFRLDVFESFSAITQERWDEAAELFGASIYSSFDWCRIWWQHYGAGHRLQIFVGYVDGRIIGILPLWIEVIGVWPCQYRVARLVGSNIPPKVFNPPLASDHARSMLTGVLDHLQARDKCDLLSLGPISELYGGALLASADKYSGKLKVQISTAGVHSIFPLKDSFEEYLAELPKKERKNNRNRYDLSLIQREKAGVEAVIRDGQDLCGEFDRFYALHTEEWEQRGGTGHFNSWPGGKEFNRDMIKAQAALGRVEFLNLNVGNVTVASIYGYYFAGNYYAELLGRSLSSEWDKYNLGRTILVRSVARAIGRRCRLAEAGLGHYDYKERLNATEYSVFQVRVEFPGSGRAMKARIIKLWQRAARLLYYKVFYKRLRKRLPLRLRKPQARAWLRLDF